MQILSHRIDRLTTDQKKKSAVQLLSLYNEPPQEELSLDEFELFALDRLQLLRGIETIQTRGFDGQELANKMGALESKYMPLRTRESKEASQAALNAQNRSGRTADQRKDQVSHFILRLAYCRTEDLRRWFLTQECTLLKYRLEKLTDEDRASFMHSNGLEFEQVSNDERSTLRDQLLGLCNINNDVALAQTKYYKIPFTQALPLVASRTVFLKGGYAYVPLQRLVSIIVSRFRGALSRALAEASNMFDAVSSDTRIGPLLKNMNKQYVGRDFTKTQATDKLTPDKIESSADAHMPLCMKNLHINLRKDNKLKHWGRLQYGLFLKGAGLSMEDAMVFWESFFTRVMSHDQFQKGYAYTFRHMYGKEGSRKNYTPFSCMKIIMGAPPEAGAYHGCPYRHTSDTQLAALLGQLKIGGQEVKEVVTLAKSGNYQLACQKHFDISHPGHQSMELRGGESVANHPNAWYQASVQYYKVRNGTATTTTPTPTPSSQNSQGSTTATAPATAEASSQPSSQPPAAETEAVPPPPSSAEA